MYASYHTHTIRCNHAVGTDEEYVKCAIAEGVKLLGFSDHAPMPYPNGYESSYKMKPEVLSEYCSSLLYLKEKYADKIDIKIGLESEYYPSIWEKTLEYFRSYPLDFLIIGQHFIDGDMNPGEKSIFNKTEERDTLSRYVDRVIEAMKTERFSYVAHPDAINYIGKDGDFYKAEMRRLIETAKSLDMAVEFNLLGLSDARHYPNMLFWEEASALGAKVILGCDSHSPSRVANPAEIAAAMKIADKLSLNVVDRIELRNPLF